MRKRLCGLALLLAAALCLTSCGAPDGADQGVTLSILGKKSDLEKRYMTAIFERYESVTGNRLNIIAIEDEDFETAAASRFESGDAPDLFMHFHNADLNAFSVADNFCDLSDESWADDLTDSARAYCQDREGRLLGLPFWENSVSGCYYNKTLLSSLGLRPAATQKEFDMLCQALADTGYTPICWPGSGCTWMPQFGLDPIFADNPELLAQLNEGALSYADIPQVTEMVSWLQRAAQSGWFGDDFLRTGWADISPALASGEAVMTFIWDTWFYTDFEQGGRYTVEDFALMPVFMDTADGGTYEGGNLNMMMVNKNGAHLNEALGFLSFCATPENYNAAFEGISTVSCFKGQTTNIQSPMVTDARASITAHERVSTAASRIVGYNANDVCAALNAMFAGKTDADGCVRMLDEYRLAETVRQGANAEAAAAQETP